MTARKNSKRLSVLMKHSLQNRILLLLIIIHQGLAERQKRRNRFYLTRRNLNPSSRSATAWEYLYESKDDRAFILTMGVGVSVFQQLLDSGFEATWNTMPIPRDDVLSNAKLRVHHRSLTSTGALGLVLHHLNSTMVDYSLQLIFWHNSCSLSKVSELGFIHSTGGITQLL